MLKYNSQDINLLRDFSEIFTRRVIFSVMKDDFDVLNLKIERYKAKLPQSAFYSYSGFYKYAYHLLEKNYQNEYIFKNAFLTDWLIKENGKTDSVVFNEFNAVQSIADLAMFNGTSRAFEIKTELDSPSRLQKQINDYKKAFNETYLIIHKSNFDAYSKFKKDVGLIVFDPNAQTKFEVVQKSIPNHNLDYAVLMQILNTQEYKHIVESYYGTLPKINSFNQYQVCFELIKRIPMDELNPLFLEQIKNRKLQKTLSSSRYKELNQICLALKLNKKQKKSMINKLKQPVKL